MQINKRCEGVRPKHACWFVQWQDILTTRQLMAIVDSNVLAMTIWR